jgi:hypothetical protein
MRAPRTTLALLPVVAAAMLLAGCGNSHRDEQTPVACDEGKAVILDGLRGAPGEVRLAGETPISGCLVIGAEEGELADLGEGALAAATQLSAEARAQPGGRANLELGYLLGALTRGSADTEGVNSELLRRLTVAAEYVPRGETLSPQFVATYKKGFAAGRAQG